MDQNPERIEIKLSEVLDMLNEGISREEIGKHFNINNAETRKLFEHEKLKGKRPKKMPSFTVVDDTVETPAPQQESIENMNENSVDQNEEVFLDEDSTDNVVEQENY